MFCYGAVLPWGETKFAPQTQSKRQFIYDLEQVALEKLTLKDAFTTIDSTKLLWGLAKFQNRKISPLFN